MCSALALYARESRRRRCHATVPGALSITVSDHRGETVVILAGELDLATAPALGRVLKLAIDAGRSRVVVDMSGVVFLGAAGIGAIVRARNGLTSHDLVVRTPSAIAARTFGTVGLASLIETAA